MGSPQGFTHRDVPALGQRGLFRLGLAPSFGIDEAGIEEGLERIQYVFWNVRATRMTPPLRRALQRDRARYVVAGGPTFALFPWQLARYVDRARLVLGTDYLDVLHLFSHLASAYSKLSALCPSGIRRFAA